MTTLNNIETMPAPRNTIYLSMPVASAQLDEERTFEISTTGKSLVLEILFKDDPHLERRIRHTLDIGDLAEAWVDQVTAREATADAK